MKPTKQGKVTLATGGVPLFDIHTTPAPPPAEEYAAEELRRHLRAMLGLGGRVGNRHSNASASAGAVCINDWDRARDDGVAVEPLDLGPEAYHLETRGQSVHVLGGGPRGVLYGVYDLLETLGCRWFMPEVTRIPRRRRILVDPLRCTRAPAFEFRDMWVWEGRDPVWWARNRMNGWYTPVPEYMGGHVEYGMFVHTFDKLVPPDEFFDAHPEYYSQIDGVRRRHGGQLCLTNPDVLAIAVERVLACMRKMPRATIFSVSQNDCLGPCQCARCRAVLAEEGAESGAMLRFVNAVAEQTAKQFPDKLIDTLAYQYGLDAPRHLVLHPNVRVRLCPICCCQGHRFGTCDHPESNRFLRALKDWSQVTKQIYIWHYCTNFANYPLPMPDYDELWENLNLYREFGVYGVFMQGMGEVGGGAETMALRGYVLSKLLWNPEQPVWPLVDEFLGAYYGRAAGDVRRYLDVFHGPVRRDRNLHPSLYDPPTHDLFSAERLGAADAALAAGEQVTRGAERQRTRMLRNGVRYARIKQRESTFERVGDEFRCEGRGQDLAEFRAMAADWRRAGVQRIREGTPIETSVSLLENRLKAHPVEWLRSGDQQLAIVPGLGGRILEWHAHGRQWLAQPDPGIAWNDYPMNEGYVEFAIRGLHGYAGWGQPFECARQGDGLELSARLPDGLHMSRSLSFRGEVLCIDSRVENRGKGEPEISWGGSLHLRIPDEAAEVRFASGGGPVCLSWEAVPEGYGNAQVLEGARLPVREWSVFAGGRVLVHSFDGAAIERAMLARVAAHRTLALDLRTLPAPLARGSAIKVSQELRWLE